MIKKSALAVCIVASFFISTTVSLAADEPVKKEAVGQKVKNFVQKIFSYPANVIQGSVNVIADTGKSGTEVITKEVKTVGEVVTGDVDKTKDLVVEPLTGAAETIVKTVEDTVKVPVEAAKEQ